MGKEKQGVLVVLGNQNPFAKLMTCCKEFETHFKNWFIKHSWEDAAVSLVSAGLASAIPLTFGPKVEDNVPLIPQAPMLPIFLGGGNLDRARRVAVLTGVHTGISRAMSRIRGKEDLQTELMAGFGAGVMVSLFSGIKGTNAITNGVFFALVYGGIFKVTEKCSQVTEKFSQPRVEPVLYNKTRNMLSSLGLDHYEKNFRNGLLTDKTLPLINDSDLQELKIPVGARRLILDHIRRENEVKKEGTSRAI